MVEPAVAGEFQGRRRGRAKAEAIAARWSEIRRSRAARSPTCWASTMRVSGAEGPDWHDGLKTRVMDLTSLEEWTDTGENSFT